MKKIDISAQIIAGNAFEVSGKIAILTTAEGGFLARTGSKTVVVYDRKITTDAEQVTYQVFVAPTVTDDGTELTPNNRNGSGSFPVTTLSAFMSPTISADGTGLQPVFIPGSTGQGQVTNGQFDQEGSFRILPPETTFYLKFTNGGVGTVNIEEYIAWIEVDDLS